MRTHTYKYNTNINEHEICHSEPLYIVGKTTKTVTKWICWHPFFSLFPNIFRNTKWKKSIWTNRSIRALFCNKIQKFAIKCGQTHTHTFIQTQTLSSRLIELVFFFHQIGRKKLLAFYCCEKIRIQAATIKVHEKYWNSSFYEVQNSCRAVFCVVVAIIIRRIYERMNAKMCVCVCVSHIFLMLARSFVRSYTFFIAR